MPRPRTPAPRPRRPGTSPIRHLPRSRSPPVGPGADTAGLSWSPRPRPSRPSWPPAGSSSPSPGSGCPPSVGRSLPGRHQWPTPSPTPAATKTACCAVTGYHVEGGSAIFDVRGTLIWYDRSVGVSGVVKSRTPCASATYSGLAGGKQVANYQSPARCGSVAVQTTLGATAATGAISEVDVTLYVGGRAAGQERCLRQTHACSAA